MNRIKARHKTYFTKGYTNAMKGIAILLLLAHHLFFGQLPIPIHWFGGDTYIQIFATLSKVCVCIFAILSGYGLSEQYKNTTETDTNFIFSKVKKLLKNYWFVFFIFVPMGFLLGENPISVYGFGMQGVFNFLADAFGIAAFTGSPTMNFTWWYIETALVFFFLFPVFYRAIKKVPYLIIIATWILFGKYAAIYCREIFWFCPFCIGIFCSQHNVFNKYLYNLRYSPMKTQITIRSLSAVGLIFWTIMRSKFGIVIDPIFALSIISFTVCFIMEFKTLKRTLQVLGFHSGNIFMIHSFIYYYYAKIATPFSAINSWILQYIVLLLVSLALSVLIESLKTFLKSEVKSPKTLKLQCRFIPSTIR